MRKADNPQAVRNTHALCSPGKIPAVIVPEKGRKLLRGQAVAWLLDKLQQLVRRHAIGSLEVPDDLRGRAGTFQTQAPSQASPGAQES
jgi:hypothetical protein